MSAVLSHGKNCLGYKLAVWKAEYSLKLKLVYMWYYVILDIFGQTVKGYEKS